MALKAVFSSRFLKRVENLLIYLNENWSSKVSKDVSLKISKKIDFVCQFPESNQSSDLNSKYRRCVVSKQTSIIYKLEADKVRFLILMDTRMNPKNFKKDLKRSN